MRVNALVVDLAMLGPDAWEFLERLTAALPGLGDRRLHRALHASPSGCAACALGADDWVTKPCHPEEVLARVEAVVRRRKRASSAHDTGPLVAGELEIRADQFQAFAGGRSVDLTRREFEVLQLLAQAEGKVLQREEIYQAVWGYTMAHGDRSVDVFIRKVRQKLEKASPDWSYIHTHFGVGYRFDPERALDGADRWRPSDAEPDVDPVGSRMHVRRLDERAPARTQLVSGWCPKPRRRCGTHPRSRAPGVGRSLTVVGAGRRQLRTSSSVRRASASAGGRVGPCASDATRDTSPAAISSQAALHPPRRGRQRATAR